MKTLHEQFEESEHAFNGENRSLHSQSGQIIHQLKEILYILPSSRHLVEFMNTRLVPARVEISDTLTHKVKNRACVILSCPDADNPPLKALALHLAAGLREIEIHMPDYRSPEMKDTLTWLHPHLSEPFEIMLTLCRIAYDMQFNGQDGEIEEFLRENRLDKIYHAYEHKHPQERLEALMLHNFNERH